MPPKKDIIKRIETNEEFAPFLDENYSKLVVVDLYFNWAGPCDAMKEFYKNMATLVNGFTDRCDILQVKHGNIEFFNNYGYIIRIDFKTDILGHISGENSG